MARTSNMTQVVEAALRASRKGKLFDLVRVFAEWPKIVGDVNARNARPVSLRGGTLVVKSESPAWADKLKYMEDEMLKRIAWHVGEGRVKRLRFVIGQLDDHDAAEEEAPDEGGDLDDIQAARVEKILNGADLAGKPELRDGLRDALARLEARRARGR
ncbi:MAG: DUF721 domain-containing protein [Deltaproteobacteria bacterium]|nr:DUF721 domain-containing protein [Deltaproteobacteria bacterium]